MIDLTSLLRIPSLEAGFDLSPDGTHIAFAWNRTGEWHIYELRIPSTLGRRGSDEGEIRQITSSPGGKLNPRYSPDGTRLAYALDFDGSESYHLFVYNRLTGEHADLTPGIPYALQPNFSWSPDGSHLALAGNQHGHFSAYILPAAGGDPQLILDTGRPVWQVEWSPDGRHLAVCCEMHGQDYGIFAVDLQTKEVVQLGLNAHDPKWSPDGNRLAFHSDLHGWFDVGVYDLISKEITWITANQGDSLSPLFFVPPNANKARTTQFVYTQSTGAFNWIEIAREGGAIEKVQIGRGIHSGIQFTPDLERLVCTFSSPSQPPDLWTIDIHSGDCIQLTHSLPEEISQIQLVPLAEIEYPGMDGVPVPALLLRPVKTPAPAVVMIHGGPNSHYSAEWDPVMAYLASCGYAVLAPNYRGSTGYGRDWQYAARFDLGGVDTRDVAAGAQYLIREGIAEPRRIAVTGRSHGGYLTMSCLTQFPELWCVGSAVVPFVNWFKSHEDSREDLQHWNIENMGDPQENYDRWYNASPYFFLDRIDSPVQLICGAHDPRCPASDSLEARDKLIELGKEVELLLYEDEGHSFLKLDNLVDAEVKRVEFLAKVLETKGL